MIAITLDETIVYLTASRCTPYAIEPNQTAMIIHTEPKIRLIGSPFTRIVVVEELIIVMPSATIMKALMSQAIIATYLLIKKVSPFGA